MKSNEAQALEWVLKSEGGFIESPSEPGGASNFGISMTTFHDWRAIKRGKKPTVLDLKLIHQNEAAEIYRYKYLNPIRFNELPSGVDYCVFDAAVQHGCSGSIRMLQKALGFRDDPDWPGDPSHWVSGDLDPSTLWAVKNRKPDVLIRKFIDVRADRHHQILSNKERSMPGYTNKWNPVWERRRNRVLERSLSLAGAE